MPPSSAHHSRIGGVGTSGANYLGSSQVSHVAAMGAVMLAAHASTQVNNLRAISAFPRCCAVSTIPAGQLRAEDADDPDYEDKGARNAVASRMSESRGMVVIFLDPPKEVCGLRRSEGLHI
jgi:hypothetical protein